MSTGSAALPEYVAPGRAKVLLPVERWTVVALFLIMSGGLWFTGAGTDFDYTRGSSLAEFIWGVLYAIAFVGLIHAQRTRQMSLKSALPVVLVVVLAVISTFWSIDPAITLKRAFGLFGTTAIALYLCSRYSLEEFLETLSTACVVIAILSFAIAVLAPQIGVMQDEYAGAWRGIFTHKNFLGEFMALSVITVCAKSATGHRNVWKPILSLVVFTTLLVKSESATSVAVCAVAVFPLIVVGLYRWNRLLKVAAVFTVGVAGFFALAIFVSGFDPTVLLNDVGRDGTLTGRTEMWQGVTQAISERPRLGYGYGVFWLPNGEFPQFVNYSTEWRPDSAHNGYLEACLDVGIPGAALFISVLLVSLVRSLKFAATQSTSYMWPLMITLYTIGINFTESDLARYNNFNWVLFIIALCYASSVPSRNASGCFS